MDASPANVCSLEPLTTPLNIIPLKIKLYSTITVNITMWEKVTPARLCSTIVHTFFGDDIPVGMAEDEFPEWNEVVLTKNQ